MTRGIMEISVMKRNNIYDRNDKRKGLYDDAHKPHMSWTITKFKH
jgi:hypothetical protein